MLVEPDKTDRKLPIWTLLPNVMTVGAICAGLTAIRFSFQGNFEIAVQLILLACVLDGLDGRVARMMKSESKMGAELDSLADFANFGMAPGLMLYAWALQDARGYGWIAVLFYAVCCVLRLARFNVGNKADGDEGPADFFVGVPSPLGALLVLLPMFLSFLWWDSLVDYDVLIALYMAAIGLLLVSRIPTYSFKTTTVYSSNIKFILIGFAASMAILMTYPWLSLVIIDLGYFGVMIWSIYKYKALNKKE